MTPQDKKIYGLIGYPVKHSLSPLMHNAAFAHLGIPAEYKLFEVKPEELEGFLKKNIPVRDTEGNSFSLEDIAGFNITIPHKVRTREILLPIKGFGFVGGIAIRQDHYVFLSGAINTVKKEKDRFQYNNTDAVGFIKSLKEDLKLDTTDKNILLFGCGGAGRAVVAALTWKDAKIKKIYIYDTNKEVMDSARIHFDQFDFVKDKLEFILAEQISENIRSCDLLVNASSVGMKEGDISVIDKSLLHRNLSIYDVVYNRETQLIKDAKSLGLPAAGGLGMLLYQGVESFNLWMDPIKAPIEIMRRVINEGVKKL